MKTLQRILAKIRAWFAKRPEDDMESVEVPYHLTRDARYWAKRDAFNRSYRPDDRRRDLGRDGWGF